jgi:hypothetical protein
VAAAKPNSPRSVGIFWTTVGELFRLLAALGEPPGQLLSIVNGRAVAMSEMESVKTRGEAKQSTIETLLGLVQIVAVLVIALGIGSVIYGSGNWGWTAAFMAFVVFLMALGLRKR